jgi:hypothetical protein
MLPSVLAEPDVLPANQLKATKFSPLAFAVLVVPKENPLVSNDVIIPVSVLSAEAWSNFNLLVG